jgi:hypothetical protein
MQYIIEELRNGVLNLLLRYVCEIDSLFMNMPSYSNYQYLFCVTNRSILLVAGILTSLFGFQIRISTIFLQDYLASYFLHCKKGSRVSRLQQGCH